MARALIDRGFTRVRPLAGGLEAWVAAGYGVDDKPLDALPAAASSPRVP